MKVFHITCLLALSACAGMPAGDERSIAERDHRRCTEQGHEFPSNAYDGCRWRLQEARHRKSWDNMQLMERSRIEASGYPSRDLYRPLPRDGFACTEREAAGEHAWIDCRARLR